MPAAVKKHTAHFAVALQGQGVPVETILKALADTYYAPKRRTLMEHMAAIKGDNAPLSTEKGSGRPPALTNEQGRLFLDERSKRIANLFSMSDLRRLFPSRLNSTVNYLSWTTSSTPVAKTKWRKERHIADFSWDAFLLSVELHRVDQESISSWWTFNFLLDVPYLTLAAIEKCLKESNGRLPVRQELADRYDQQVTRS